MKKLLAVAVAATLTAGCAGTPQFKTQYGLDSAGNITSSQVQVQNNSLENWKTAAAVGAVVLGVGGLIYAIDRAGDNGKTTVVQQSPVPNNGLILAGGTSSFTNDFIQPIYTPIGQPSAPVE